MPRYGPGQSGPVSPVARRRANRPPRVDRSKPGIAGGNKPTLSDISASRPPALKRKMAQQHEAKRHAKKARVQRAGVGFDLGHALGFDKNLALGLIKAAQGVPTSVIGLRHPVREGKQIVAGYKKTYGPLAHGKFREFERNFYKNPAPVVLDAAAAASTVAGAAAKTGLLKVPKERSLSYGGGHVQPQASPNTLTRLVEHRIDRYSEKHPDKPVVGAKARVARHIPFEREREHERALNVAIPFHQAAKKLSKSEGYAYDRLLRYGDKAPKRVEQEIAMRRGRLVDKSTTLAERRAQRKTLIQLEAAHPHVHAPSPQLLKTVALGRDLAKHTQETKIGVKQLTPETAAARIDLPSRIVTGTANRARAVKAEYRGQHQPASAEPGASMDNLGNIYPPDLYSPEGAHLYGHGGDMRARDQETVKLLREVKGKPNAEITVYRSMPRGAQINPGDWVTPTRSYAQLHHARSPAGMFIGSRQVRVGDLYTEGNSIHEWGWNPPKAATAGEGAAFVPDISRTSIKSIGQRMKSVTGKPRPLVKKSEGILFTQGRIRTGPKLTVEDFQKTARYKSHLLDIAEAAKFSKPLDAKIPGGLEPGHRYFNPEGVKLPRSFRDAPAIDDLEGLTPKELSQTARSDYEALVKNTFPDEAGVRNLPPEVAKHVRQIDEQITRSFESGGTHFSGHGGTLAKAIGGTFDLTNNITRDAAIYLKGAYVPANFAGNAAFGVIHAGPWYFKNLVNASAKLGRYSPETLRRMDIEVGQGPARALAGEGKGPLGGITKKIANVSGNLADTGPRRAAFIHEAGKRGYKTEAQVNRLLTDPSLRRELNQIGGQAEAAMVKFRGLSADERKIISRAIFVYPWVKGATRYGLRLPLDRPGRAALLTHMGQTGSDEINKKLGKLASFMEGIVPMGGPTKKYGTTVEKVWNPQSVTPVGTAAQVGQIAGGLLSGKATPTTNQAIQLASPLGKSLVEASTGYNTFLGEKYPRDVGTGDILFKNLVSGFPISKLAAGMVNPPKAGPPGRHLYVPEGGGRLGVLKRFGVGSLRTRELNLPASQALAEKEQRAAMDPVARVREDGHAKRVEYLEAAKKAGLLPKNAQQQPDSLRKAFALRESRYLAYAKAGHQLDQRERFAIDQELLVRMKKITPAQATEGDAWAKKARDRDIQTARRLMGDRFFGTQMLEAATRQINAHGGDVSLR